MPGSNTAVSHSCLTVCASTDAAILFQIVNIIVLPRTDAHDHRGKEERSPTVSLFSVIIASGFDHTVICMDFDGLLGSDCGEGVAFSICSEA